jgi:hypothetical protein
MTMKHLLTLIFVCMFGYGIEAAGVYNVRTPWC